MDDNSYQIKKLLNIDFFHFHELEESDFGEKIHESNSTGVRTVILFSMEINGTLLFSKIKESTKVLNCRLKKIQEIRQNYKTKSGDEIEVTIEFPNNPWPNLEVNESLPFWGKIVAKDEYSILSPEDVYKLNNLLNDVSTEAITVLKSFGCDIRLLNPDAVVNISKE